MSLDKRYPAFLLIIAVFLGLFLFTSNTSQRATPAPSPGGKAVIKVDSVHKPGRAGSSQGVRPALPVFPIDLNKATLQELMLLPGIGEKTAARIIEKRAELKGFRSVDELMGVKWVGKAKLEKLRGLVTIGQPGEVKAAASR
jgi:competence protein ComEA